MLISSRIEQVLPKTLQEEQREGAHSTSSCSKQSTQAVVQPSLDNTEEEWTEVRKRRKGKEVMANPLVSDNSGHSLESERTSAGSGSLVVPSPIAPTAPLDNPGSNGHSGSAPPSSPPGSRPGTPPSEGSPPPSHLSIGQDLTEPSTASPDQNPLGRLAVGSVERYYYRLALVLRKVPSQNPKKVKNKSSSPPLGGGGGSPWQVCVPPFFVSDVFCLLEHQGSQRPFETGGGQEADLRTQAVPLWAC